MEKYFKIQQNMTRDILGDYTKDTEVNKKIRGHLINSFLIKLKDGPGSL